MNNGVTAVNTAVMGSLHAVVPRKWSQESR